jgi:hypothetical protein
MGIFEGEVGGVAELFKFGGSGILHFIIIT